MSSSSSSSYPYKHDQKLKSIVVDVEENETMNKMKHTSPQEVVSQRTFIQRPSFSLSVVPTLRETMETSPPKSDRSCDFHYCKKEFSSPQKEEREVEMLWNKMESSLSNGLSLKRPYNSFHDEVKSLFSQVDLSSHSHLGSSRGPLNSIRDSFNDNHSNPHETPYQFFTQNPSYSSSLRIQGPFVGPFKYGGGGSNSSNEACPLINGAPTKKRRTTMFPAFTPNHFLTEKTHYNSHASSNGNHITNLLGPSKFTGDINNMRNVYSWFNGGVTRGTTNMNIANRPRYHSFTGNIPSFPARPHPPPQTTNQCYDFFAGNIPSSFSPARPRPPPQTTNPYYDFFARNLPSSSHARPRPPPQTTNQFYGLFARNILSPARPCPPPQTTNQFYELFSGNIPSSSHARPPPPPQTTNARPRLPPQTTNQYYDFFAGNIPSSSLVRPRAPPQTTNQVYDFYPGNIHSSSPGEEDVKHIGYYQS